MLLQIQYRGFKPNVRGRRVSGFSDIHLKSARGEV